MKVTVIPVVIDELSRVTKGLVLGLEDLEIRGRVETTVLLRLARILRRVLETYCHSDCSEKPLPNAGMKKSQMSKIIIMMFIITLHLQERVIYNIYIYIYIYIYICIYIYIYARRSVCVCVCV